MIAVSCDHAAIGLKNTIKAALEQKGIKVLDFGAFTSEPVDYPDYALAAAESVALGECEKGIIVCGTGIGMSIAANKVKGIRCAVCGDCFSARASRQHNDANMLALGERVTGAGLALEIVDIFLSTPFSAEKRHKTRIDKISGIERKYFK